MPLESDPSGAHHVLRCRRRSEGLRKERFTRRTIPKDGGSCRTRSGGLVLSDVGVPSESKSISSDQLGHPCGLRLAWYVPHRDSYAHPQGLAFFAAIHGMMLSERMFTFLARVRSAYHLSLLHRPYFNATHSFSSPFRSHQALSRSDRSGSSVDCAKVPSSRGRLPVMPGTSASSKSIHFLYS